ncbi:recQ-mediated genome instability 1, putative [Babesia ovis]|uniref:RecQ-mediated genome instability 1, putative n=1 Tax=Babesia ovis TaxID=5869 RepID=A0A9W5WUH7_BABOV|nr:recQ-mediated genome instability 1, putative [Babesia ovis]
MASSQVIDDTVRADYDAWIRSDWTLGADSTKFNNFMRHTLSLYQVVSSVDVRVSMYRQLGNEDAYEDSSDDDKTSSTLPNNAAATRMLRLVLHDGTKDILAYEYEPIACLDVFHANRLTGNPVRCCGKIALFNEPIERRGALWLTRSNVKLLFEGFICRHFEFVRPHENTLEIPESFAANQRLNRVNNDTEQMTHPEDTTHTSCHLYSSNGYDYESQMDDADCIIVSENHVRRSTNDSENNRTLSLLEEHFPRGSPHLMFSYISFLLRSNSEADETSFAKHTTSFLRSTGLLNCFSIAQALSRLNKSPSLVEPSTTWFEEDTHYGFLDFAVPLDIDRNSISEVASNELRDIGFSNNAKLWLVNLNDCFACFFCLVSLDTLQITEDSPLDTSRKINSIEGFFKVKCFTSEGYPLFWISEYRKELDKDEFIRRTQVIKSEYEQKETLLNF